MAEHLITIGQIDASDTLGTTLHHAAQTGNKKAIKKVLAKGIDVDYPNDEGQSALFCACLACKESAVEFLLEAGANPNEKSNQGLTPVHVACYAADVKCLIKLLNKGADLRLHDNQGHSVKDWAMLHEVPKKRMKILEFLDKTRLFAMSHSGQDLLLHRASSHTLNRAHQRHNSITKVIRDRIGRPSVHDNLESMAMSQHSVGFGQVYANSKELSGFLSAIPLVSENNLRHDPNGETFNNGAFCNMESMWWEYTQVTVKKLHKDVDPYHGGVVDLLINEIEQIGKLRHPNILTLMGVCQTSNLDGLILVYERIEEGSLYNYLHQKMERLPSQTIRDIAVQMCNAIIFIHLRGLVHSGITSHAISVVNDRTFKLSNFQYMVEQSKCELGKKNSITTNTEENSVYNWMAPEIMFNFPPSFYCDMYSYCAVLWEIFHGEVPFDNQCAESIKSFHQKGNMMKLYHGKMADYYKIILDYGLQHDPNNRKLSFLHVKDLLLTAPKDINQYVRAHFQHLQQNDNASSSHQRAPRYQPGPSAPPGIPPPPRSPTKQTNSSQNDNVVTHSPFSQTTSNQDDNSSIHSPMRQTSNNKDDSSMTRSPFQATSNQEGNSRTHSPFRKPTSNQADNSRTQSPLYITTNYQDVNSRKNSPFRQTTSKQDDNNMPESPFCQTTSKQVDNEISSRTERSVKYNDRVSTSAGYPSELLKKDKGKHDKEFRSRHGKEKAVKERKPKTYIEDSEEDYEFDRTRQVRNRSNNCSHSSYPQFGWVGKQFVPMYSTTPKKPARSNVRYHTDSLQWECKADREGDNYNYTVTVENSKNKRSPMKQPRESRQPIEARSPIATRQTTEAWQPIEARSPGQTTEAWQPMQDRQPLEARQPEMKSKESDSATTTTGSTDDSSKYAKGMSLERKKSSMGRFSYLNLPNLQKPRTAGAKPACHGQSELVSEEYSTIGKLTTAGSLYALYNEHSPDLPLGQPEYRYSPEKHHGYTLPRTKQSPPPPMKSPDKAWFGGRGSVRDLAKCFQEQIMEHDYNQRLLEGKLNSNCSSDGQQQESDEQEQEQRQPCCPDKSVYYKPYPDAGCMQQNTEESDNLHSSACSLTTVSDAESDSFDPYKITYDLGDDSSSAFTSIDSHTRLNAEGQVDSSTESDIVSKWVDHEIRKIGRKMSRDIMINQSQAQLPVISPDLFDMSENQQGPRQGHEATSSSSDQNARAAAHEAGDQDHYIPDQHTFFDDEIYRSPRKSPIKNMQTPIKSPHKTARRMSPAVERENIYLDDQARSPYSSPYKSALPMESVLTKPEDQVAMNQNAFQEAVEQRRKQRSKSRSRVPTCKLKLPTEPEGAFANIVTVKSSLDQSGVHSVVHEMKNLKTGDKKTIAADTVTANKIVTTFKANA